MNFAAAQEQHLLAAKNCTSKESFSGNKISNSLDSSSASSLGFTSAFINNSEVAAQNCLNNLLPQSRPEVCHQLQKQKNSEDPQEQHQQQENIIQSHSFPANGGSSENLVLMRESFSNDEQQQLRKSSSTATTNDNLDIFSQARVSTSLTTERYNSSSSSTSTSTSASTSTSSSSGPNNTEILANITLFQSQQESQSPESQSQQPHDLPQPQILLIPSNELSSSSLISSSLSSSGENSNNFSTVDGQKNKTSKSNKNSTQASSTSPNRKQSKGKLPKNSSSSKLNNKNDEDSISKTSDTSLELLLRSGIVQESTGIEPKAKAASRLSERAKKKSWYNLIYPNYKSRAEDFKKLFKEVPNDERLIVDYSCALQRDILVQGRLYVSQNYLCFHANIFSWETYLTLKWKDVTSITKEKTALVIPNAISICTAKEKYFFATFAARDKAFLMLFRVWQNTLMNKQLQPQEIWQYVHNCYGEELGLTTDDEDYIDPTTVPPIDTETELEFISAVDDNASLAGASALTINTFTTGVTTLTTFPKYSATAAAATSTTSIGASSSTTTNTNIAAAAGAATTSLSGSPSPENNLTHSNLNQNSITAGSSGGGGGGGVSGNSSTSSGSGPRKSKTKSYFFTQKRSSSTTNSASASGSDNKASGDNKISSKMKANAKEITLISAKPEESVSSSTIATNASLSSANSIINDGNYEKQGSDLAASNGPATSPSKASVSFGKDTHSENRSSPAVQTEAKRKPSKHKSVDNIPTDASDSSEFENNTVPFVATTSCTSDHEGRQLVHTILPINVDVVFNMLFSKSKFLIDFHNMRQSTDLVLGEWLDNSKGQKTRTVHVTVQVAASVGPKTSRVTEDQVMRECSKKGELYSIDVNSTNSGIPYADSFCVLMHYCLVRTVDDHTMLSVHAQIKYKKSIWAVVKGFIEKNTWAGLEDFYSSLLQNLQNETCLLPAKSKGRRSRRGTGTVVRHSEEPSSQQHNTNVNEPLESGGSLKPSSAALQQAGNQHEVIQHVNTNYRKLSIFIVVLLAFLLTFNVILLSKLWKLEERVDYDISLRSRLPDLSNLKSLPSNHQEWMQILREQEILHEKELQQWHKVLQTAIALLKKTEKTLAELMFH